MTTIRTCIAGIAASAILSTGTAVQGQTVAAGPYYATPAWDQKLPAATRFIVLSNWNQDAILDRETGLVWQRSPDGSEIFFQGLLACSLAATGGRAGWRLPSLHELESLIDPAVGAPGVVSLPAGHPFVGITTDHFLTATSFAESPSFIFVRSLEVAAPSVTKAVGKGEAFRIWCVRGGGPIGIR
jgi:hypothetical protein